MVKFGIFADLHVDIIHDGQQRLEKFLDACRKENVDFVIQLGDFCYPDENRKCVCAPEKIPVNVYNALNYETYVDKDKIVSLYRNFEKPAYHVIGNHDCDLCSKKQLLEYYGAETGTYYSFDAGEVHFVVIDGNFMKLDRKYIDFENGNYFDECYRKPGDKVLPYVSDSQLEWLKKDLASTQYKTVIFSHQGLVSSMENMAVLNQKDIKEIIDSAPNGVVMAINGHEHLDMIEKIGNTWYYNMNSMSNAWMGKDFLCEGRYGAEIDEKFPNIKYTAPYADSVYAIITVDENAIDIKGTKSDFVGPTPEELGSKEDWSWCRNLDITASVKDRYIDLK